MKFRAPTIVFNAFWKAGLIFGSAFAVGFFAWPWVAYGEVTLETFEGYTTGNLNGQSSWISNGSQVVTISGNKAIEVDAYEYAWKNYNVVTTEVFAFDLRGESYLADDEYQYLRFCNGVVTDCTGVDKAGFVIKIEGIGGDLVNVYNMHSTGDPDTLGTNISLAATTSFYFMFFNNGISFSTLCESYGCSMINHEPYYASSTIDDLDGFAIESNGSTNDLYYDNFRTMFYSEVAADPNMSAFINVSHFTFTTGIGYEHLVCDIGYECRLKFFWTDVNDGNTAYLVNEAHTSTYDSENMFVGAGRYDFFSVPASSTVGIAHFDIMVENENGFYKDSNGDPLAWYEFDDVWVVWQDLDDNTANDGMIADCTQMCSDMATTTDETLWEWMSNGVGCAFRVSACWLFKPSKTAMKQFRDTVLIIDGMWPYSMVKGATELVYETNPDGTVTYVGDENATTTLDGAIFMPNSSSEIAILSNKMWNDSKYSGMTDVFDTAKEKITLVLYIGLFVYMFIRIIPRRINNDDV